MLDAKENIFGAFTRVKWDSKTHEHGDGSLRSFLLAMQNPKGTPPRRFALRAEKKHCTLLCSCECSP
jgi:hypothetical protein